VSFPGFAKRVATMRAIAADGREPVAAATPRRGVQTSQRCRGAVARCPNRRRGRRKIRAVSTFRPSARRFPAPSRERVRLPFRHPSRRVAEHARCMRDPAHARRDCVFPREKPLFLFARWNSRRDDAARDDRGGRPDAATGAAAPGKFFSKMVDIPKMRD